MDNKPKCVGMIMDGNRRWGKANNLSSFKGHERGYSKMKDVAEWCLKEEIPHAILHSFSTENWNRSPEEVSYLMELMRFMLEDEGEIGFFKERGVRVTFIGDMSLVPKDLLGLIKKTEEDLKDLKKLHLVLCFSYGGRREILNAVKEVVKVKSKEEMEKFTEEDFSKFLWTGKINVPDPDLIIRTSGEMRTSGFLPWQAVYSELFFTKTFWPDFSYEEFRKILEEYSTRHRRLGK